MTRIARSKFALLAGAMLAVTAGSFAYGAVDGPDKQIVIVEKHGGGNGDESVRTVTRDGKTFIFQTDRVLTDAEVEQRISAVEARILPVLPAPVTHGPDRRVTKQRVIILDEKRDQVTDVVTEEGNRCKGKDVVSNVETSSEADGKLTQVRVRMCGVPGEIGKQAMAEAIDDIRKARDEIAQDNDLPDSTRKEVLQELDAELARLKRKS